MDYHFVTFISRSIELIIVCLCNCPLYR